MYGGIVLVAMNNSVSCDYCDVPWTRTVMYGVAAVVQASQTLPKIDCFISFKSLSVCLFCDFVMS